MNYFKIHSISVCNTIIKHQGHQFIITLLFQFTTYIAVICIYFITQFQFCCSKMQGLCYKPPICYFISHFCADTAMHLQHYIPTLFCTPQYFERQSKQHAFSVQYPSPETYSYIYLSN